MSDAPRVLVVEDEDRLRDLVVEELAERGLDTVGAADLAAARALLAARSVDVLLLDVRLPDGSGLDLLGEVRADPAGPEVVIVTAHGSVDDAVDAMRRGAFHYATKPFVLDEVEIVVRRAAERTALARRARVLERLAGGAPRLVGESPAMCDLRALVARVADADATVLIEGETGTGKELVARAIHAASPVAGGPFVPVNCGALQEGLLESELFGHEKGAFTGAVRAREGLVEVARGGTLFLDEVGEMPAALQVRLLRVLEEGEVRRVGSDRVHRADCRVVAATNRDLKQAVKDGDFREDLYYRLAVVPVAVPPLRDRREDIPDLVQQFLVAAGGRRARTLEVTPAALRALAEHAWPGNVRELRNVVERMTILAPAGRIDRDQVPAEVRAPGPDGAAAPGAGYPPDLPLSEVDRLHTLRVLDHTDGNKTAAARILGITVRTLYNRLEAWRDDAGE